MKKITLLTFFYFIAIQFVMSQDIENITNKGPYILINSECNTSYKNYGTSKYSLGKSNRVLIKKDAILTIIIHENSVIITTSEFILGGSSNVSKWYEFDFSDIKSAETFFLKLADKLTKP